MDVKPLNYPPKILLAWAEAISGNKKIGDWLVKNGYKELGIFTFALRNKDDARQWLMENGYPHLMAMINAVERNPQAYVWLRKYKFQVLEKMAIAGDGSDEGLKWLAQHGHRELAIVAQRIRVVKDEIEDQNNDMHRISPD